MTTILEAGSTQWYGLLYPVWGQLAQVAEIQNATAGGEANLIQIHCLVATISSNP